MGFLRDVIADARPRSDVMGVLTPYSPGGDYGQVSLDPSVLNGRETDLMAVTRDDEPTVLGMTISTPGDAPGKSRAFPDVDSSELSQDPAAPRAGRERHLPPAIEGDNELCGEVGSGYAAARVAGAQPGSILGSLTAGNGAPDPEQRVDDRTSDVNSPASDQGERCPSEVEGENYAASREEHLFCGSKSDLSIIPTAKRVPFGEPDGGTLPLSSNGRRENGSSEAQKLEAPSGGHSASPHILAEKEGGGDIALLPPQPGTDRFRQENRVIEERRSPVGDTRSMQKTGPLDQRGDPEPSLSSRQKSRKEPLCELSEEGVIVHPHPSRSSGRESGKFPTYISPRLTKFSVNPQGLEKRWPDRKEGDHPPATPARDAALQRGKPGFVVPTTKPRTAGLEQVPGILENRWVRGADRGTIDHLPRMSSRDVTRQGGEQRGIDSAAKRHFAYSDQCDGIAKDWQEGVADAAPANQPPTTLAREAARERRVQNAVFSAAKARGEAVHSNESHAVPHGDSAQARPPQEDAFRASETIRSVVTRNKTIHAEAGMPPLPRPPHAPEPPRVTIGQIDVVVEVPVQVPGPQSPVSDSRAGLTSRHYLRRL